MTRRTALTSLPLIVIVAALQTPASYQLSSGEQFVAISVGGGDVWGKGDYVVAFRLRR